MKPADIMQAEVRTVTSDISVSEVVVSLADAQVTGLPVVGARNRVIGLIVATDLISAQSESQQCRRAADPLEQTGGRHLTD
jgi:CBS domain-containing protein